MFVRNVFYFSKKVRLFSQNDVLFLFYFLINPAGTTGDQSRALEDRNDSNNSLEVYTPNSFIHLFYNSPYMDVIDIHNMLTIPSDSVLREKTMEAS